MRYFCRHILLFAALGVLLCSCGGKHVDGDIGDASEPLYLRISERPQGGWIAVSVSPFDGSSDTLVIDRPMTNIIVMSTSHYGFLDALGRTDIISGISGPDFLFSGEKAAETPVDVGYDGAPDYEKIVALGPEVVLTYAVSGAKSQFVSRLEQLGIKVFTVNEHLERHPLARAAYIRLFGALCGQMDAADSLLTEVKDNYNAITDAVKKLGGQPRKVLLNIPYNDQWFVPASDNYLTAMIQDAGGTVLGTEEGKAASSVMSVEKAYSLSKSADCWLNIGWCRTIDDLLGVNPIFKEMLNNIKSNALELGYGSYPVVWNDNKRMNPKGGNDIWQSGVARPDLVLRDLSIILHPDNQGEASKTIYYRLIN